MRNTVIILFALAIGLSFIGCKSSQIYDPIADLRLKEQGYTVSGEVVGEAEAMRCCGAGSIAWNKGAVMGSWGPGSTFGASAVDEAREKALYDALGKLKDSDMIIAPKYEVEATGFGPIYQKAKVKVTCKGVKLSK